MINTQCKCVAAATPALCVWALYVTTKTKE